MPDLDLSAFSPEQRAALMDPENTPEDIADMLDHLAIYPYASLAQLPRGGER